MGSSWIAFGQVMRSNILTHEKIRPAAAMPVAAGIGLCSVAGTQAVIARDPAKEAVGEQEHASGRAQRRGRRDASEPRSAGVVRPGLNGVTHGRARAWHARLDETRAEGTYNLAKGKWQTSFGYRHFRSFRHFVGSVEQNAENTAKGLAERDRAGTQRHQSRPPAEHRGLLRRDGSPERLRRPAVFPRPSPEPGSGNAARRIVTSASGISDLTLMGRYWLGDPRKHSHQNLSFGLGFKLPTGNDRAEDDFLVRVRERVRASRSVRPVDQSIQPGDGGFGFITGAAGLQGLRKVRGLRLGELPHQSAGAERLPAQRPDHQAPTSGADDTCRSRTSTRPASASPRP